MKFEVSRRSVLLGGLGSAFTGALPLSGGGEEVTIAVSPSAHPRVMWGAEKLKESLGRCGYRAVISVGGKRGGGGVVIVGNQRTDALIQQAVARRAANLKDEAFTILVDRKRTVVAGGGDSGAMYGCLELAEVVAQGGKLPQKLEFADEPKLRFRGTCLLWMKWGGLGYDWPVTRANFPWFFDRELMRRYLDFLAENRFNTLYFWSGHPFPYFLRLPKYPEARMLEEPELRSNIEHFDWFTKEADRRGIWTVLQFYNIHVTAAFAEAHKREGVKVTNPVSTPLLADYTRHCISEFINNYPSVGLLVCAGEALSVQKEEWIRDVIIAGAKDTGKQPPIIVREWTIDRERFKEIVLPSYSNLYTMMKHNVEMIVSPYPDARNKAWIALGNQHFINVHENGDVKPLRWAAPSFIRQMVEEWAKAGVSGCHVYPMVSWQWPQSLDRTDPPLSTLDRDWMWLQAFGRYTWSFNRDETEERSYWVRHLEERFGSRQAAESLLIYYEIGGPILTGIQNQIAIHNMNAHPTLVGRDANLEAILHAIRYNSLDSYLSQPLDRVTVRLYAERFGGQEQELSKRPPMSVHDYVEHLASGAQTLTEPVITPRNLFQLFDSMAGKALDAAKSAAGAASKNQDEARRFVTDAEIIREVVGFYQSKTEAAIHKGLYDRLGKDEDATEMLPHLEKSVEHYGALTAKASKAYRAASDLTGVIGWKAMLAAYQEELAFYKEQARLAKSGAEILCLGVNGPFEDFSNAFHWGFVEAAAGRKSNTASYFLSPGHLEKAKLAIVYNLSDSFVIANEEKLLAWIGDGGRLLIWDEHARLSASSRLTPGLEVVGPIEERNVPSADQDENLRIRFADVVHPLLGSLKGRTLRKANRFLFPNNLKSYSKDWSLLAYSILFNKDYEFLLDKPPSGPIWVKREDSQFCPLMLERTVGTGKVAVMQLGRWNRDKDAEREFCATLASNILGWAGL